MSGTFATIEKETAQDGCIIAVKTYTKSHGRLVYEHYQREINALKKLDMDINLAMSEHIVYLISARETADCYQLLFPFYNETLGTVSKKIHQGSRRSFAYDFIRQIAKGLSFLHEKNIVHCDLSPNNILMDASGCMFISDFGCSQIKEASPSLHEEIGTRWYKAPEHLFSYQVYAPTTDVWSLGAIFAELLLDEPLFAGESDLEQIGMIVRALGNPSDKVQEEISVYPDLNKLVFFTTNDFPDNEGLDSDDEQPNFRTLTEILMDANLLDKDLSLITDMLTWSRKDRATLKKVCL